MPPKKKTQTESVKKYVPSVKLRAVRGSVPYTVAGYSHLNDANPAVNSLLKASEKGTKTLQEPHVIKAVDVEHGLLSMADDVQVPVHIKVVHLLDPAKFMRTREGYIDPTTYNVFWDYGHSDLRFEHNKGYTETVAYHLTSVIGSERGIPHYTKWYGAVRGLAASYNYDMDEDFDVYRFRRWFWANYEAGWFDLDIREKSGETLSRRMTREEIIEEFKPDDELLTDEDEDVDEDESMSDAKTEESLYSTIENGLDDVYGSCADAYADASADAYADASAEISDLLSVSTFEASGDPEDLPISPDRHSHKPYSDCDGISEPLSLWMRYRLHAVIPHMPVIINFLEKHEGSMDKLMEEECGE